jgi:hypothetical protein
MVPSVARFDIAALNCLPRGSSNNVHRIIRVSGSAGFKTDAARGPPNRGMEASKRIMSGFNCDAESIAGTPSSASPQISYLVYSSRDRMRRRIDGMSSTMKRLGTRYCYCGPTPPSIQGFLYISALRSCCRFGAIGQFINHLTKDVCPRSRTSCRWTERKKKMGASPATARLFIVQHVENFLIRYRALS